MRTGPHPLSRIALTVLSAYAGDFNRRYSRVGHLFQGRFKASRIVNDRHLLAVVCYIHRNPVDAGMAVRSDEYAWSSDQFYRRGGGPRWLDCTRVTGLLSPDSREAIHLYARLMDTETTSKRKKPALAYPAQIGTSIARPMSLADGTGASVEVFAQAVALSFGEPLERLRSASRERSLSRARALTALLARELAGIPLSRTAWYFGRDESTVARAAFALQSQCVKNPELRNLVDRLRAQLSPPETMHD